LMLSGSTSLMCSAFSLKVWSNAIA
jgi:hypothetical protein